MKISKAITEHAIVDGKMQLTGANHIVYTIPPNQYYAAGDGVGGKAGRKVLPPVLENTYQALVEAWGGKEEG